METRLEDCTVWLEEA